MANITRNFIKGRMNKSVDERLIPDGEYIDAINVRMGSTEGSEIGVIENAKGNLSLTKLQYNNYPLSTRAKCIGAYEDGANETIYWFVHDPYFARDNGGTPPSEYPTGILDLIVSYNATDNIIDYHVISVNDGSDIKTTLNFDPKYLITGVDLVENLLFFTDNKNAPRFINIKSGYDNPVYSVTRMVDYGNDPSILTERLLVIKKPPLYAPTVELQDVALSEDNYLEGRFICFAYRYRYADGEYSATSPFSDPAFAPKSFDFSANSLLNEGMVNKFNSVNVFYNTGGPLVESVELLFKEAQNSIIKVIDKFNKKDRGFSNNATQVYTFTNSNIFTILPDSEILRLYDNVPRFALAQTIMGNRLVYGNYIDGYNLERNGVKTQIEYTVDLISENISIESIEGSTSSVQYDIPSRGIGPIVLQSGAQFDFSIFSGKLKKGSVLEFQITFEHDSSVGFAPSSNPQPTIETGSLDINFSITLTSDYTSTRFVSEFARSTEFINKVGNISPKNILPVYDSIPTNPTSCDGITFTDEFNCAIPNNLDSPLTTSGSVKKWGSAISGASLVGNTAYNNNEPIGIVSSFGNNILKLELPYMRFVNDLNNGLDTTEDIYEFYKVTFCSVTLTSRGSLKSLHSNRGYETGIVYMDDYGRSSTSLVSNNNSLHVPCSASSFVNKLQVTIPPRQIAPEWATNYKFVIKPDEENYDVIYSNIYYRTTDANYAYFLLEGESTRKVNEGDRLIVKKDSGGATGNCVYVTVLEKSTYGTGDIQADSLAGTYMKIGTNEINITEQENATILYGLQRGEHENSTEYGGVQAYTNPIVTDNPGVYPFIKYPMSVKDSSGNFIDYDMPLGSRVALNLNFYRDGTIFNCDEITMSLSVVMTASKDYNNMWDFLNGENFQGELNNAIFKPTNNKNIFYDQRVQNTGTINPQVLNPIKTGLSQNIFWWYNGNGTTEPSYLMMVGTRSCNNTKNGRAVAISTFDVYRSDGVAVFETQPQDALPDVWFESADTYSINSLGEHSGSEQDQVFSTNTPAITITDFYNCFSFGNGAESYKIRDSIVGKTFNLGNRVYTTDEQEYKEAHRFADLTYSGVYNEENNLNKLNEFNLGLLNFKPLERSFGTIQKLFGRETDILTLQEDRISYVLQGKEMITGSTGGSSLITVPEVLGKQVARIEEYGISNNPESFVQWGADKYFTDAKRGAVIQLKGAAGQNEKLTVISEQGMRSWFRDLFIDSFETQKLGGFDPYMGEYVLSSNDIVKPVDIDCIDCGVIVGNIVVDVVKPYDFCVDVGDLVGDVTIDIDIDSSILDNEPFTIEYTYAGVTNVYNSLPVPVTDTITIQKNSVADQKVSLVIESFSTDKSYIRGITVGCPEAETITIIPVSITSDADNGKYIHSEYSWTDGTFISPLHSRSVNFKNDNTTEFVISDYSRIQGLQGAGVIPADGATVSVVCNKINFDDFVFNEGVISPLPIPPRPNNFRYLRSDTLYDNNVSDIKLLLAETLTDSDGGVPTIDNTDAPDKYSSTFTMPNQGSYLYLIWDYRSSTADDLCFGETIEESCCNCEQN